MVDYEFWIRFFTVILEEYIYEEDTFQERLDTWPLSRLRAEGFVLLGLSVAPHGKFFRNKVCRCVRACYRGNANVVDVCVRRSTYPICFGLSNTLYGSLLVYRESNRRIQILAKFFPFLNEGKS